jgi:hypothetical protein
MTIKTIHYSESRESAVGYLKQWKKFGAEAELSERESPEEAMQSLAALVGKMHNDMVPKISEGDFDAPIGMQMVGGVEVPLWQPKKPDPKQDRVQQLIQDIGTVTELKVLESYRLMVKANPDLQTAYDNKLQELNQQK